LTGVKGKQPDGTAKTREAKLGCVFTQTATSEEGSPIRDPDSTSLGGRSMAKPAIGAFSGSNRSSFWETVRNG